MIIASSAQVRNKLFEAEKITRSPKKRCGYHLRDYLCVREAVYRFQQSYPNIKISIIEDNSNELENKIIHGALDIAIVCLPVRNPHVNYTVFYRDPCLIAVPKDHPMNEAGYRVEGEPLPFMPVEAFRNQRLVLTSTQKKSRAVADRALRPLNGAYEVSLESHNIEAVIRFVARGLGVSIIPSVFAQNYAEPDHINYYRMEEKSEVYHEWAVLYGDSVENLPRPSRELYHILCDEKCIFPEFLG